MHGNEFRLFMDQGIPPTLTIYAAQYEPFLRSLVMPRCRAEIRTYHLPDDEALHVEPRSRVIKVYLLRLKFLFLTETRLQLERRNNNNNEWLHS